jgi:hypothetical protein
MITRQVSRVAAWVAAGAVLFAMSGCAAAVSAANPAPEPTSTAAPVATAIMVRGASLDVMSKDGQLIQGIPYSGGAKALVSALTAVLGAPVSQTSIPNECDGSPGTGSPETTSKWNGDALVVRSVDAVPTLINVKVQAPSTVNGIEIETAGGLQVGDSSGDLVKAVPDALSQDSTHVDASYVWYDLAADSSPGGKSGVLVFTGPKSGPIYSVSAPETYFGVDDGASPMIGGC